MAKEKTTKRRIERAALKFFVTQGIAGTTTREIAGEAGVAEGTLYRYFVGKEELALQIFMEHHVRLAAALEEAHQAHPGIRDKVSAIVERYCAMADADWMLFSYHLLAMHLLLPKIPPDTPNPVNVVHAVIREAMEKEEIPRREPELVTSAALGVILQPAIHKVYGRLDCQLSGSAKFFTAAIWRLLTT